MGDHWEGQPYSARDMEIQDIPQHSRTIDHGFDSRPKCASLNLLCHRNLPGCRRVVFLQRRWWWGIICFSLWSFLFCCRTKMNFFPIGHWVFDLKLQNQVPGHLWPQDGPILHLMTGHPIKPLQKRWTANHLCQGARTGVFLCTGRGLPRVTCIVRGRKDIRAKVCDNFFPPRQHCQKIQKSYEAKGYFSKFVEGRGLLF